MLRCSVWILSSLVVLAGASIASATTIQVQASDLPDPGAGDLWSYSFSVSGTSFSADIGFSVLFDPALYTSLQLPPLQPSPDWDVIVLQPDLALPDDGVYDALALVNGASLATLFTVEFLWLGAPGSSPGTNLPFTVQQFASDGTVLAILETGGVTVPEPTLPLLFLLTVPFWRIHRG